MRYNISNYIKNWSLIITAIALAMALDSCSSFDKIMKSKDYEYKYQMALKYYEARDHARYLSLFESLQHVYRSTMRADTVDFYICEGNYYQGDYLLAAHYYDRFRKTYTRSSFTDKAEYMYAYCYYKSSPRAELDQSNTMAALTAFAEYLSKYPQTPHKAEIRKYVQELNDKLMEKSYLSSKLYYNMGNYKSALVALRNSINKYPNSKYREEQMYLLLRSAHQLAEHSVRSKKRERLQNTIDEYYNFASEYPNSKYSNSAKNIYESASKALSKYND